MTEFMDKFLKYLIIDNFLKRNSLTKFGSKKYVKDKDKG